MERERPVAKGWENQGQRKVITVVPLGTSEAGVDLWWQLFSHQLVSDSLQPHGVQHACPSLPSQCPQTRVHCVSDVMDWSPPGSSVHGISQARIREWVAVPFSRRPSRPRDRTWVSCIAGRFFTIWVIWKRIDLWSYQTGVRRVAPSCSQMTRLPRQGDEA